MKPVSGMTIGELAAFVCSHLKKKGIEVVLSGGACVSIYTMNRYTSDDLDFIENVSTSRKKLKDNRNLCSGAYGALFLVLDCLSFICSAIILPG